MTKFSRITILLLLPALFFGAALTEAAPVPPSATDEVTVNYIFSLSTFSGSIPYSSPVMYLDVKTREVYVFDSSDSSVRIFNGSGMETYSFTTEELGNVRDIAVDSEGNILLLADDQTSDGYAVARCNYRGEFIDRILFKAPPNLSGPPLRPERLLYRNGLLYLVDKTKLQVLITDLQGNYRDRYDLASLINLDAAKKSGAEIVGFSVDDAGNMLFTIPVLFTAYSVSPDRQVKGFGEPGSAPGKFNIVGGIAADSRGYYYVADMLRCVVMVFDGNFKFITQFGYRGAGKDSLVGPRDLAVGGNGLLYVTQLAKKGISVFRITYNGSSEVSPQY